jgi:hypothetical protein
MANDAAFTLNLRSSGTLGGVVAAAGGTATWAMPVADWNALKSANKIYYRVTTTNASGGDSRSSLTPGNGFLDPVPPAVAIVNESGECELSCGSSSESSDAASLILIAPLIIGTFWLFRLKKAKK